MIDLEVITGSGYYVNPKKIEYTTCSYIGIFLDKGGIYSDVASKLENIREITECHYTTGQYAIFIKVYAKDNEHLKSILSEKIQKIPGISSTETFISLEETFKRSLPVSFFVLKRYRHAGFDSGSAGDEMAVQSAIRLM